MPVDDPRAVQVVGGGLAAHAGPGEDADPEAAHLAGDVPEYHVIVVELDSKHGVGQRLDHLALEFDLVFLCHELCPSVGFQDPNYQRQPGGAVPPFLGPPVLPAPPEPSSPPPPPP